VSQIYHTTVKHDRRTFQMSAVGDDAQTTAWKCGTFYEWRLLKEIARRELKGTYVDVGANFGNHSVFFGNFCPADRVIAIEPFEETQRSLIENLKRHVPNSTLLSFAVSDRSTTASMHLTAAGQLGSARIKTLGEGSVIVKTLDELLKDVPNIVVIKIDIEGREVAAIAGGMQIIKKHRPLIVAECFRQHADAPNDFDAINALLGPIGYVSDGVNWCVSRTCIWTCAKKGHCGDNC